MSEIEAVEAAATAAGGLQGLDYKTTALVGFLMLAIGGGTGSVLTGVSQDRHDALVSQVGTHEARIERLEERERDLFIAITQVRQDQAAMKQALDRIEKNLERPGDWR